LKFHIALSLTTLLLFAGSANAGPHLRPHPPLVCKDNQELKLVKRVINADAVAVIASDNCRLTLDSCEIVGGGNALKVSDNAEVKLRNSMVQGHGAMLISENASVSARGSRIFGRITTTENGEFKNKGGNTLHKGRGPGRRPHASPPADAPEDTPPADEPAPARLKPAPPVRCVGSDDIRLHNRLIKTGGDGVAVVGSCNIFLTNCRVEAGKNGIAVTGSGNVTLRNTEVIGRAAAISILGSGNVVAEGCRINGKIRRVGTGKFVNKGGNTIRR